LPEGHITDDADLALLRSVSLCCSLVEGILLSVHVGVIFESEYSDEERLGSMLTGDRNVCSGFLLNMVYLLISLSASVSLNGSS
jgi:hypothetical protein